MSVIGVVVISVVVIGDVNGIYHLESPSQEPNSRPVLEIVVYAKMLKKAAGEALLLSKFQTARKWPHP